MIIIAIYNLQTIMEKANVQKSGFWFYHMIDKSAKLDSHGIESLEYMYKKGNMDLFLHYTNKYRNRLCNGWRIYPGVNPKDLTAEDIYKGLVRFRGEYGTRYMYFFKYPPYLDLDPDLKRTYKNKALYRVNLGDPQFNKSIVDIDWGYYDSDRNNESMDEEYYRTVPIDQYYSRWGKTELQFAALPHIAIVTKENCIPLKFLEKVETPKTIRDVESLEYRR